MKKYFLNLFINFHQGCARRQILGFLKNMEKFRTLVPRAILGTRVRIFLEKGADFFRLFFRKFGAFFCQKMQKSASLECSRRLFYKGIQLKTMGFFVFGHTPGPHFFAQILAPEGAPMLKRCGIPLQKVRNFQKLNFGILGAEISSGTPLTPHREKNGAIQPPIPNVQNSQNFNFAFFLPGNRFKGCPLKVQ